MRARELTGYEEEYLDAAAGECESIEVDEEVQLCVYYCGDATLVVPEGEPVNADPYAYDGILNTTTVRDLYKTMEHE